MLEKVDLKVSLNKDVYKTRLPYLRSRLYDLQKNCWGEGIPSVILFEGWDAAGKGSTINLLSQRLDPRGFQASTQFKRLALLSCTCPGCGGSG